MVRLAMRWGCTNTSGRYAACGFVLGKTGRLLDRSLQWLMLGKEHRVSLGGRRWAAIRGDGRCFGRGVLRVGFISTTVNIGK